MQNLEDSREFTQCPECKQVSLQFNKTYKLYECMNETCKTIFSEKDLARKIDIQKDSSVNTIPAKPKVKKRRKVKYKKVKTGPPIFVKIITFPFRVLWWFIRLIFWFIDWED